MKKIELEIIALSHTVTQSNNYALVLGESGGSRRLPIVVGGFEAQAIAIAMERMHVKRPLTHDLMKNIFSSFDIELKEIIINNLYEGVFYARLICVNKGETLEIDSRTSDALALAVRCGCPIYTYEFILEQAGVVLEDVEGEETSQSSTAVEVKKKESESSLSTYSTEDLNKMLEEVLTNEDYERAAKIRDELNNRG